MKSDQTFAFIKDGDSFVYVKSFGVIVFINCNDVQEKGMLMLAEGLTPDYVERYDLEIREDQEIDVVSSGCNQCCKGAAAGKADQGG